MPFEVHYLYILLVRPLKLIARCAILSHVPKITEATLVSSPPRSPPSEGFHLATTFLDRPYFFIFMEDTADYWLVYFRSPLPAPRSPFPVPRFSNIQNSRQMAPVSTICDEYCSFFQFYSLTLLFLLKLRIFTK